MWAALLTAIESNPTQALNIIEDIVGLLKANPSLMVDLLNTIKALGPKS